MLSDCNSLSNKRARKTCLHAMFSHVVKREAFSCTLALIITAPLANAVDIAPVFLLLWMF